MLYYKHRLTATGLSSVAGAVVGPEDVIDLHERGMYADDNKLKEWGNVIGQLTLVAERMKTLESCVHLKRFAAKT